MVSDRPSTNKQQQETYTVKSPNENNGLIYVLCNDFAQNFQIFITQTF